MTISYTPLQDPDLSAILLHMNRTFEEMAAEINGREVLVLKSVPLAPYDGWIAIADGVNWNPGLGAGTYIYWFGLWHRLGTNIGIPSDIQYKNMAVATYTQLIADITEPPTVIVNAYAGTSTITLLTAGLTAGDICAVVNDGTDTLTVNRGAGSNVRLESRESSGFTWSGSKWEILG